MIKRILKMFGALGGNMGITLLTQFMLPPAFIHSYGVNKYGEWLVVSGTLSYLSTLNFGITSYASNELTMLHKRGETEKFRQLQASTLGLLLGLVCLGLVLSASVFLLPLKRMLHLSTVSEMEVQLTGFFLGLQMMAQIISGYYSSIYMVVEQTHRGYLWLNANKLSVALACFTLALFRVQFHFIALGQFLALLTITLLTIFDLKRKFGKLQLGIKGANWKTAKATLTPSGMFGLMLFQNFLTFQAPMIMLQWILGPKSVVVFSISRTILSSARQMLSNLTLAISPEITFSFADRNMKKLLHLFHFSEKIVFGVIPVANLGAVLLSPILLQLWLRKPFLYDPYTYGLMALISGAMSMREHKQFYQFATNRHKRMSLIVFFTNIVMIIVSIPMTMKFGLLGFMVVWLLSEVAQMGLIYYENKRLFNNDPSINLFPVLKLWMVMLVSLPICLGLVHFAQQRSLFVVGAVAVAGIAMLCVESYFVFGLKDVWDEFQQRRQTKALSSAPA
jgi:O-antigen/teichoic acid export membrane protein